MKKILIDCGAHVGGFTKFFLRNVPTSKEYEIHLFEPNPRFKDSYKDIKGTYHPEAVWISDGEIELALGTYKALGSTIIDGKKKYIDYNNKITVKCIDFGKWIKDNFNKDDYIVLKMNMEGAEYEVLPKMFKDGSIEYINLLFGELHKGKFRGRTRKDDAFIMKNLHRHNLSFLRMRKHIGLIK